MTGPAQTAQHPETTERLFIYGTLAPGRPNEHVLAAVSGTWEPAAVRGRLLQHGWGAEMGYPGIVLDEDAPEVQGMLFSSTELAAHWARLDVFEGEGYDRVMGPAHLPDGTTVPAHVYILRPVTTEDTDGTATHRPDRRPPS